MPRTRKFWQITALPEEALCQVTAHAQVQPAHPSAPVKQHVLGQSGYDHFKSLLLMKRCPHSDGVPDK